MLPALIKTAGEANVKEENATTGAEDFSFFAKEIPGFYFFIGGKPADAAPDAYFPHHTPDFYVDDSGMLTGVKAFINIVYDYLQPDK